MIVIAVLTGLAVFQGMIGLASSGTMDPAPSLSPVLSVSGGAPSGREEDEQAVYSLTYRIFLPVQLATSLHTATSLVDRQRIGFVATSPNWRQKFDVSKLNAGWYADWYWPACAVSPGGMDRAIGISVRKGSNLSPSRLGPLIDRHPANMWLIGNEPDCVYQDNRLPEDYARIYHDLYTLIKGRDPTSQVLPAGIVQATPLRLQWLSLVVAAYQANYGEQMPADAWHIHNQIVNEQEKGWGGGIPPGIDVKEGVLRDPADSDRMDLFEQQIRDFRRWMEENGYEDYPLIITEYGILMPDTLGFDVERVNSFMSATFDFLLNATDDLYGYSQDGNRLVQRWAWFSLDWPPYDPDANYGFNGNLFDPESGVITDFGLHFASQTSSFPSLDYVDLIPGRLQAAPKAGPLPPMQTITQTVQVEVLNVGSLATGPFSVTLEYDGAVRGVLHQQITSASPASSVWLDYVLTDLRKGKYDLWVRIDPGNAVSESTECNNEITSTLLLPSKVVWIPLVARAASPR